MTFSDSIQNGVFFHETPYVYIVVPTSNVFTLGYHPLGFSTDLIPTEEFLEWCTFQGLITAPDYAMLLFSNNAFKLIRTGGIDGNACFSFGRELRFNSDLQLLFKVTWG